MQQSAPLLAQEGTVDTKAILTVKKGTKTVLKQPQTTKQDSRTNKRNHYNFRQNMDKNPGSCGIKTAGMNRKVSQTSPLIHQLGTPTREA